MDWQIGLSSVGPATRPSGLAVVRHARQHGTLRSMSAGPTEPVAVLVTPAG